MHKFKNVNRAYLRSQSNNVMLIVPGPRGGGGTAYLGDKVRNEGAGRL